MVDLIGYNAINKLIPIPNGPPYDDTQSTTLMYQKANNNILNQTKNLDMNYLTSGEKKDYVLTNRLAPNNPNKKICIYGWKNPDNSNIQPLNPVSHDINFIDYSQSPHFIYKECYLNNNKVNILDILKDPILSKILNSDGILNFISY